MKITIDSQTIDVEAGTTILQAARVIGGECVPPTMCYYSTIKDCGGKCRCCLVEVTKGSEKDPRPMPKLQPSCVTLVQEGMEVKSATSPRALQARKAVSEFLLVNHPLDCPICDQAGECDLQDLAYGNKNFAIRSKEERLTFAPENIGPYIEIQKNRCVLCYRCVKLADQLTDGRVQGVLNRGDHAEISTYISAAIDNDFSGNMIDVCPVGALTDKTFRFQSRVWFNKAYDAHRSCPTCSGKVVLWVFGDTIQRVTARKNQYNEVEEFICNSCRFDHKKLEDWTVEGPRKFSRLSVLTVNAYTQHLDKVKLNGPDLMLYGREQDREKISMEEFPFDENEIKEINKTLEE